MTEPRQFEAFMRAYQDLVFSTAIRLLGNESDAADIAQEVFLKAFEHYEELSRSATAGGWLRTVARNLSLNHLTRYRARWRFFSELSRPEDEQDFVADLPAPDTLDRDMDAGDRARWVETALHKLPETQRVPLVLYHFEDLSYDEIAAKLRVSLSKVKTDIHRAREALKRHLQRSGAGMEFLTEGQTDE